MSDPSRTVCGMESDTPRADAPRADMPEADPPARSGHPVLGALSPSRAGDYNRCPLLYRFRTIDRFPERPSEAAVRGTLVHAVLESLYDLPAGERTQEAAVAMLPEIWAAMYAEHPSLAAAVDPSIPCPFLGAEPQAGEGASEKAEHNAVEGVDEVPGVHIAHPEPDPALLEAWLAGAEELLGNYFAMEDPMQLQPAARELRMEVQLTDDLLLRGVIDRVDVTPDGLVRVVDYKTGRSPSSRFEESALFQMLFYALMIWRDRGVVPHTLQLNYLKDKERLRFNPTESKLEAFAEDLEGIWAQILDSYERGEWTPRPSRLCDWCDHQSRCPAQGGELPELPMVAVPVVPPRQA